MTHRKNLLSCEQLQIAVYTPIAWSYPAGKKPSFSIVQLFQKEIKQCKAKAPNETQMRKDDYKILPQVVF